MRPTPLRQLAEQALGEPIEAYVLDRRRAGSSWRQISTGICAATQIDIAPETLRLWFKRDEVAA